MIRGRGAAIASRIHSIRAERSAEGGTMAAKKKAAAGKAKGGGGELIISKSRTKAAAKKCNVSSEFYGALDKKVREIIAGAEGRAAGNKRKTLRAVDI
jgi:hypothetical protein